MKTRHEIVEILQLAQPDLARECGLRRLALFGSYARGDAAEGSDVDVLVEVDPSLGLRFVDLAERIESLLGLRADVVSRRAIAPRYWADIEKELVDVAARIGRRGAVGRRGGQGERMSMLLQQRRPLDVPRARARRFVVRTRIDEHDVLSSIETKIF